MANMLTNIIKHTTLLTMPIIHVHGQLGNLSFGDTGERMRVYGPIKVAATIGSCLGEAGIKIIGETDPSTQEFVSARKLINAAEHIIFLGFGYDHTNLYRLGILDFTSRLVEKDNPKIWITGSAHGLSNSECGIIENKLNKKIDIDYQGDDALVFLRNRTPFS